jgi:hypothetical protein
MNRRERADLDRWIERPDDKEQDALLLAVLGPDGIEGAPVTRLSWLQSLIEFAEKVGPSADPDMDDPEAFWMCVHEVKDLLREAKAAV